MQTECELAAFQVLYQDEQLLAVHKPAALLVHRSPIDRHETRFALQMARDLAGKHVYPVHRLDKATSGLLLFALSAEMARCVAEQFAEQKTKKTYLALVRGWPYAAGVIDKPLRYRTDAHGDRGRRDTSDAQVASTAYRLIAKTVLDVPMGRYEQQRYALVEVQPRTGRKHQIRRHLVHINHPIIGDVNYGDRHHNHLFFHQRGYHRLYLAAVDLELTHPLTQQKIQLRAPLQSDFQHTLEALGLPNPSAIPPSVVC